MTDQEWEDILVGIEEEIRILTNNFTDDLDKLLNVQADVRELKRRGDCEEEED